MTGDHSLASALITQSFAKEIEYRRAVFMIWSFWARCSTFSQVILFTDNPEYFRSFFGDQPVKYVVLTPDRIMTMRGKIDFLHRMKIALIEEAFQMMPGNLIYADSDTFFIGDPSPMVISVNEQTSYMHLQEYRFDSLYEIPAPAGTVFHKFVDLIKKRVFLGPSGDEIDVSPRHFSWNAGIMIFHTSHKSLLPDVYALTDEFYPATLNHACEQYAFSIVLQNRTKVLPCNSIAYHYWYKVKKQIMDAFLVGRIDDKWAKLGIDNKVQMILVWTRMLPRYFDTHVLSLRDNAIQAFHEGKVAAGYAFALKALAKQPLDGRFLMDVLYHTRRIISGK